MKTMRALFGLLVGCYGADAPPDNLVVPEATLGSGQPWVFGGAGLALTAANAAPSTKPKPIVLTDEHLQQDFGGWSAGRPVDAPSGAELRTKTKRLSRAPVIEIEVPIASRDMLDVTAEVRTSALVLGERGGGAALVVEEVDAAGERVDLHDGVGRLSGDTDWTEQRVRLEPRRGTKTLKIRLEAASGSASGAAAFRTVAVQTVGAEAQFGAAASAHHDRMREVKLGRITRPALLTRAGEHWTARVPAGGGTLEIGIAVPDDGASEEVCFKAHAAAETHKIGCIDVDRHGDWVDRAIAVPPAESDQLVRVSVEGPAGSVAFLSDPVVRGREELVPGQPDLALIVLDTLRADHLGAGGYTVRPTSPNLDAFADRFLSYPEARSTSGWTAASLGSVMTGLLPSRHRAGARRERSHEPEALKLSLRQRHRLTFMGLRSDRSTVPELLRRAGYRTVSWVDNTFFSTAYGFARGFEHHDRYAGDDLVGIAEGVSKAMSYLEGLSPRRERAPVFMVVHAIDPHAPYQARVPAQPGFEVPETIKPEMEHIEGVNGDAWSVEDVWKAGRVSSEDVQVPYDSEIRYMDEQLAPLLAKLDSMNAGVVILSDHGEEFFEHKGYSHGRTLYEEMLRVPLFVRTPGADPRAGTYQQPVSLDAVAATILEFAGLSPAADMQKSLPLDSDAVPLPHFVSEGVYKGNDITAVRKGDLKLVLEHADGLQSRRLRNSRTAWARGDMSGKLRLYDLKSDPGELQDALGMVPVVQQDAVVEVLYDHLRRAEVGLHLRCRGPGGLLKVESTEPITRFVPFQWKQEDIASITSDRRGFEWSAGGEGDRWGVLRLSDDAADLVVAVDGVGVSADISENPQFPTALRGGECEVWRVRAPNTATRLDADELANLEALGYVE